MKNLAKKKHEEDEWEDEEWEEQDSYNKKKREEMVDAEEMTGAEAGFMEGWEKA